MKRKSLAQITYEKCGGVELHGPWDRTKDVVKYSWEQSTKVAIRQAMIRLKWTPVAKKYFLKKIFPEDTP
jgi:hypothetical protein